MVQGLWKAALFSVFGNMANIINPNFPIAAKLVWKLERKGPSVTDNLWKTCKTGVKEKPSFHKGSL